MRKKLIALFSALAMVITVMCSAFPVAAAAGTVVMQTKASKTTIKQGETVTIDLMITQNPGLVVLQTLAVYDEDAFEMVSVTDGKLLTGLTYMEGVVDKSKVMWINYMPSANATETGKLYSVVFKAKDDIEDGDFDFTFDTWGTKAANIDEEIHTCTIQKATVKVSDGRSDDATLKSLVLSNKNVSLSPAFAPATENYTVTLPNGSKVPTVTATKNNAKATIQTTQATSFNTGSNVATIVVTAEKGNTKTYTVTFIEINALLSSLKVNGETVTGFDPNKTDYTYEVSYADWKAAPAKTYAVTATAAKEDSTVEISEESAFTLSADPTKNTDKEVTVIVTPAQENTPKTTYKIKFTVRACVHDYVLDETKSTAADCTHAGKNVSVCSVCDGEKEETVNALGHDESSEWTVVEATCMVDGSRTQYCSRCNAVIGGPTVIKATGHVWSLWTKVEGTNDYTRTCSKCNDTQTRTADVAADGHTHAYTIEEIIRPATCSETGIIRNWCSNENCASYAPEDTVIPTIDHDYDTEREEPTCTTEGRERQVCSVCGDTTVWTVISVLGHDWSTAWTTDDNDHWHACTRCDAENEREAHSEDSGTVTTPATSVSNGIKTYSCSVCGKTMRTEVLPMTSSNGDSGLGRPAEPYVGAPIIPFGGVSSESMSVRVENAITGKTSSARAQRNGNSVSVKLGAENNGYYANVFTTDGEYIYSAVIEGGKADFNAPGDVKIKIVIDSIAYGEDVSSAAAAEIGSADISSGNTAVYLAGAVLLAAAAVMTVFVKKRANK